MVRAKQVADFFGWSLVSPEPRPQQKAPGGWWRQAFRQPASVHRRLTQWAVRQAKLSRAISIDTRTLTFTRRAAALLRSIARWLSAGIMEVRSA